MILIVFFSSSCCEKQTYTLRKITYMLLQEAEKPEEEKATDDQDKDLWEETFKTHTDSKPKGPFCSLFPVIH